MLTFFMFMFASPHKHISKSSLTKCIISLLNKDSIDTETCKSHSLRAASSSEVSKRGITTKDVLGRANWKAISVWEKTVLFLFCKLLEISQSTFSRSVRDYVKALLTCYPPTPISIILPCNENS